MFLLAGAAATFVVTPILDRTHAFKKVIAVLCVVCTLAFTAAAIELRPGNAVLLYVLFGIVGAAYVPSTTAFVELGCEVAYPVPESTSSGKEQSMVLTARAFVCEAVTSKTFVRRHLVHGVPSYGDMFRGACEPNDGGRRSRGAEVDHVWRCRADAGAVDLL